ncbi:hypothetical protein SAMN05216464_10138 [Mucilaginibacter pineti]|uniref:MG2 domain-containing protein n=1 Tax=Mucilaginibacter pineti TaxID=1391627 RepID=A0A1G6SV13_9SPHI|nr:carboxypeptidase-like regulatory domain-containing protein [Mucilaginibacter pineti]SDD19965.1 hypothetical protein SAMN05216464_10138 [Mucilaginibacter pineti]
MLKSKSAKVILPAFFLLATLTAFIKVDGPIDKIVAALNNWTTNNPQEKVYLHTDKPYYALGDTIWFKAYVTVGSRHQLSALSGAVYADLINEKDSVEKSIKLPLSAGMAKGNFVISDTLMSGNYRIRAYTQWMRNAGPDYYYDHTFAVIKGFENDVIAKVSYQYKLIDKKPRVIATINYTGKDGSPLASRDVSYKIVINKNTFFRETAKTDASGNVIISIPNDAKTGLDKGGFIVTAFKTEEKTLVTNAFAIKANLTQSDVQFFPESGNLVTGITSRVGFKAVAPDGNGIDIKGSVIDNANQEVATFQSEHAGMGKFMFKPEDGKTYTAKITYPDGTQSSVGLPKAQDAGYVLAVYNNFDSDTLVVRINASPQLYQTPQVLSLVAQTGGEMIFGSQVKIARAATSVFIPKKDFPTGIAQFTLFNSNGQPLNERISFIRTPDLMQLKLTTAKQSYKAREKVEVMGDVMDGAGKPVAGTFSVSVIDESKVPVEESAESTILSNILLTSDLKGYIEKPNYYFTKTSEEVDGALDNLMLTQGYRRFVWKDLLAGTGTTPALLYPAEKLNTVISGRILSLSNKPVPGGKITLFSLKTGITQDTVADAEGKFSFPKLVLADSIKFSVQGRTPKDGTHVIIKLDKIAWQGMTVNKNVGDINTDLMGSKKEFVEGNVKEIAQLQRSGKLNRVQQLQTVSIKGNKPGRSQGMFSVPEGHADQTFVLDHAENCATLLACVQGRLAGVTFEPNGDVQNYPYGKDGGKAVPMNVYINGEQITDKYDVEDVFTGGSIDPADVVKIDVVRTGAAMKSYLGGLALLITVRGSWTKGSYHPEIANISPRGFSNVKDFYSPKYDAPQSDPGTLTDLRSTIYWNPGVKASTDGKLKFDFFNADEKGTYKVIIEGINASGQLGRQVYKYKVE